MALRGRYRFGVEESLDPVESLGLAGDRGLTINDRTVFDPATDPALVRWERERSLAINTTRQRGLDAVARFWDLESPDPEVAAEASAPWPGYEVTVPGLQNFPQPPPRRDGAVMTWEAFSAPASLGAVPRLRAPRASAAAGAAGAAATSAAPMALALRYLEDLGRA